MSRDEYNRLLLERLHGERRWENEAAEDWTVADLDAVEITRTFEEAIRRGRIEDPGTREPEEILRGFGLTPEALLGPHESLPWNPLIAAVFYRRGIIEAWGRGTLKMAELAQQAGLPRLEIEDAGGCVTVRFRPSGYVPPHRATRELTERQRLVLAQLAQRPGSLAVREITAALGLSESPWKIREDLATLKGLGLVQTSGWGRGARWELTAR